MNYFDSDQYNNSGRLMRLIIFSLFSFSLFLTSANSQSKSQRRLPVGQFRAAWVATVRNMDWPSQPGLSAERQKKEALLLLDKAVDLKLNAVIFQVRPHCDAFYESKLEPWSFYLQGVQGKSPGYDPLQFWITEAHKRGLELHAWFNPFRMKHPSMKGPYSERSIAKLRPQWCYELKKGYAWLDPGIKEVQDFSMAVIMDVVKRYDIDGVHLDDYFYPYPEFTENGFPDSKTYASYRKKGGVLSVGDWRRSNINTFVKNLNVRIKGSGKLIRFGVSPFGIWRPNHPKGIMGLDAYEVIYADSKKWLQEGWVDYLAPQLYWAIDSKHSFTKLLDWWRTQNTRNVDIYPGLAIYKVEQYKGGFREIIRQIGEVDKRPDVRGYIHFNLRPLLEKEYVSKPISESIKGAALVPPLKITGFDAVPENVKIENKILTWTCRSKRVRRWLVYIGDEASIYPGTVNAIRIKKRGRISVIPIGPAGVPGKMISIGN